MLLRGGVSWHGDGTRSERAKPFFELVILSNLVGHGGCASE